MQAKEKNEFLNEPLTREDFLCNVVSQLVERRKELGYTQEYVDHLMGNTDRTLSKWECGVRTPTSFNLYCWVESLSTELSLIRK